MNKFICGILAIAFFSINAKAQKNFCATDAVYNKLKAENPEIGAVELSLGIAIQQALLEAKESGKFKKTTGIIYNVPIVVHIVHDYGAEYLTDDGIYEAVDYWDKVFNKQNADTIDVIGSFKNYIGNPEIRLHLATIDPNGNPTKGITRRQSYMTSRGGDQAKVDDWPNNKYINIWFVNKFDDSHSGAAAYAYLPASAAFFPYYDGLISVYSYYNSIDKTVPHELGHVLNLNHPWGGTNSPGLACGDDGVPDTPPTYGHTKCAIADLYDTRCATGYTDLGGTFYPNSPLAPDTSNTQNIMDYSYCAKMFTIGQADRMRASITSSVAGRSNLITTANLAATGALASRPDLKPIADFSIDKGTYASGFPLAERTYFLCQNSTSKFTFRNRSWNDTITDVNWTFSNGPSTSTSSSLGNVFNSFTDAGWATVTLSATGNNSGTSTINRQAVYIASTKAYPRGYNQYFNYAGDFDDWPMFNYYNNNFKWEFYPSNGYADWRGCIRYRSFDARSGAESYSQPQEGDFDDIFTPAFDLTDFSSTANLNFYTSASATTKSSNQDSMEIFASTNCGDTWVRIAGLNFTDIINVTSQNTEFAPTLASHWKPQTINIPSSAISNKTFFRFRYWPSNGANNFYLDQFSVSPWTTEIKNISQAPNSVNLVPNPTSANTKLCFTTSNNGEAAYTIRDVTGRVIFQKNIHVQPNTFVQEEINRSIFPSTGLYLITLTQSNQTVTNKLVVE